jgi:hypothetical protein
MSTTIISDADPTRVQLARLACTQATKSLRSKYLKCGDTIYAILRHVSKSGTTRYLDLYIIAKTRPYRITKSAADAIAIALRQKARSHSNCGSRIGRHRTRCQRPCMESVWQLRLSKTTMVVEPNSHIWCTLQRTTLPCFIGTISQRKLPACLCPRIIRHFQFR